MRATRLSWLAGILLTGILVSTFLSRPASAQDTGYGYLTGTVHDAATKEILSYSNVIFTRVTRDNPQGEIVGGTMAFDDGVFFKKVPAGNYIVKVSHISYETASFPGIFVAAEDTVRVQAELTATATGTVEKQVVVGKVVRTAEGSMLKKLKNEEGVADALTSEQMGKASDGNTAEALERVTGVSVLDGKYVYVRGLGERYSQTTVNGAGVGTPEPNKKVVPMDIFPTGLVDNIVIHKTFTPDMDGEFAGSVIDINTKDFARNSFSQSLSLGYGSARGADFLSYKGGSLDFLGFDDGTRALPGIIDRLAGGQRVDLQTPKAELVEMGTAFKNIWNPRETTPRPNFSYSGMVGRKLRLLGRTAGFLGTAYLSNSASHRDKEDNTFVGGNTLQVRTDLDVNESKKGVLGGVTGSLSTKLNDTDKVKLNLLYTRSAEDKVKVSRGLDENRGTSVYVTELTFVERGLFSGVLQGDHELGLLGSKADWNLSLSHAVRGEPDRRRAGYDDRGNGFLATGAGSSFPFTRIYGESIDEDKAAKLNWTVPLGESSDIKSGFAYRTRNRESSYRRFGFQYLAVNGAGVDLTQTPEVLLSKENLENSVFRLQETTRPNDSYSADQTVKAAYTMAELGGSKARLVTGVRYEDSDQNVEAKSPTALGDKATFVEQSDTEALPSVNFTLLPHKNVNVRLAWAKTLNRPELRELSPFTMTNYETGYDETGDTTLVTARIDNYDTRLEFYPGPGEFLALGAFYKDFERPIQKFVAGTTGGYAVRPQNAVDGYLYGWEAEVRVSGVNVWKALDWTMDLGPVPAFMTRWSLVGNYSRVNSEAEVLNQAGGIDKKPFAGQSDYSANLGVFYSHKRWESGLLYKTFGKRLDAFALSNKLPDVYEHPPEILDFVLNYRISGNTRVKFSAENLLNEASEFRQADEITQRYKQGVAVGISFTYQAQSEEGEGE
ncbi:MAG: outer membrane beta-barrel protein [Gemmatimonadota bacterium]|jgi:outer membrane receptor protein involved in Fe transport